MLRERRLRFCAGVSTMPPRYWIPTLSKPAASALSSGLSSSSTGIPSSDPLDADRYQPFGDDHGEEYEKIENRIAEKLLGTAVGGRAGALPKDPAGQRDHPDAADDRNGRINRRREAEPEWREPDRREQDRINQDFEPRMIRALCVRHHRDAGLRIFVR